MTGSGTVPEGRVLTPDGEPDADSQRLLERLALASVLANDAMIRHRKGNWVRQGDAVDVATLIMAHKAGVTRPAASSAYPEIETIPFESERLFCASVNQVEDGQRIFVKGALERLLPMCSHMATLTGDIDLDTVLLERQARELASESYRLIAVAAGDAEPVRGGNFSETQLRGLTLIGLIGMIDPLRPEASEQPAPN